MNLNPRIVENYTKALLLLFLTIMGNYIAELFGCRLQYLLTNNMIVKNIVLFGLIYFTLNFTSTQVIHPTTQLWNAIIIWISFTMFSRTNIYFTLVALILLIILFILENYNQYYEKTDKEKYGDTIKQITYVEGILEKSLLLVVLVGFIVYFTEQYTHYGNKKQFLLSKFILGKHKCRSAQSA
jgi:hypothetical protein